MIHVMDAGFATPAEIDRIRMLPDFRKATRNMAMAYASLERIATAMPADVLRESGLVFGSSHGELETTKEFLKALAEQKIARPILFQNSLHNSTVGFLAMKLGIVAPTVTVSNGVRTVGDALEAAWTMLDDGTSGPAGGVDTLFVTVADGVVPDLRDVMEMNHGSGGKGLGEGAATLLLTTRPERFARPPIARFRAGIGAAADATGDAAADPTADYDTDALERLVRAIADPARSRLRFSVGGELREIAWERPA